MVSCLLLQFMTLRHRDRTLCEEHNPVHVFPLCAYGTQISSNLRGNVRQPDRASQDNVLLGRT